MYVKDVLTESIATTNFECSIFGPHTHPNLGWVNILQNIFLAYYIVFFLLTMSETYHLDVKTMLLLDEPKFCLFNFLLISLDHWNFFTQFKLLLLLFSNISTDNTLQYL